MRAGTLVFALIAALLLSGCDGTQAFDMDGRQIGVPVPSGFKPTKQDMPSVFKNIVSRTLPSTGRMVEFYVDNEDARSLKSHEDPVFLKKSRSVTYIKEGRDFTAGDFASLKAEMLAGGGSYVAKGVMAQNQRDEQQSQRTGDAPVVLSDGRFLGVFLDDGNAIGRAHLVDERVGAFSRPAIHAVVAFRVRDRGIVLKCTSAVTSESDIRTTEKQCEDWAGAVMRTNAGP
ncbi:hypothetical protein [Dyella terrae]|uniref:hypothetical protein n=1 Tax=Dyella terrae TaxID=522259 RepID=UPI001EFCFB2B|nr:hypothetical protein [Dyella terrae]ULU25295.1 hypothetical protein DYST_02221 [Dyella terrae]